MEFKRLTMDEYWEILPGGSGLEGYVQVSYTNLLMAFGEPDDGDGEKSSCEWLMQFTDGTVATIYDYQTSPVLGYSGSVKEENTNWRVGGVEEKARLHVAKTLGVKSETMAEYNERFLRELKAGRAKDA